MSRKGYYAEYIAKKKLIKEFGKQNVIKMAIGQTADYIILSKGRIEKIVEVKDCHKKKYYPSPREKKQIACLLELAKEHDAGFELWVRHPYGSFDIAKLR